MHSPSASATSSVIDHVQHCLRSAPVTPEYGAALAAALALPGNILSDTPNARWAKLVWTCCTAAGGQCEQAVPVAAAVEIFMVALDVLDDIEDGEATPLHANFGSARTLNISTGLLFLAQQCLLNTAHGSAAAPMLLDTGLCAASGQHADLADDAQQCYDLDAALAITAGKSASLVAVACQLGALAAGADAATQARFAQFGRCLGMVAQLTNDIVAVAPGATAKTDIVLARPTLPLVYATSNTASPLTDDAAMRATLWNAEPTYLTWVVAEAYRCEAVAMIPKLTQHAVYRAHLAAMLPALCWTHEDSS
jgi:geranylgeranyl pyrophosphate synthase